MQGQTKVLPCFKRAFCHQLLCCGESSARKRESLLEKHHREKCNKGEVGKAVAGEVVSVTITFTENLLLLLLG